MNFNLKEKKTRPVQTSAAGDEERSCCLPNSLSLNYSSRNHNNNRLQTTKSPRYIKFRRRTLTNPVPVVFA